LNEIQGTKISHGLVMLAEDQTQEVTLTDKLEKQFNDLLGKVKKVQAGKLKTEPLRCSSCRGCLWLPLCSREWQTLNHISLLSGMSASWVRKLAEKSISTCHDIAETEAQQLQDILDISYKQCERFIWAAKARLSGEPLLLRRPEFPEGKPVYFYDIETYEDQVFCHGIVRSFEGNVEETYFFAEGLKDEEKCWHAFLNHMEKDTEAVVYCWTLYEKTFVNILWKKYGGSEKGYQVLQQGLIDQCAFVRDHFALPCRGYSIKAVAPFFDFKWQTKNANGMNCVAWYHEWLHSGNQELREKIVQYNLDDVRAMEVIDCKLKAWIAEKSPAVENQNL